MSNIQPPPTLQNVLTAFGFGIDITNEPTEHAQMKYFVSLSREQCLADHGSVIFNDDNICATPGAEFAVLAAGDQGGPITNTVRTQLFGIISYWPQQWLGEQPSSVFVDLSAHSEFLGLHLNTN